MLPIAGIRASESARAGARRGARTRYPTGIDCRLFCRLFQFTVQNYSTNSYIISVYHKSVNPNLWRQSAEALYASCEKLSCRNADGTLSVVHVRYTAEKRMISGFHRCMVHAPKTESSLTGSSPRPTSAQLCSEFHASHAKSSHPYWNSVCL